ncbi:unnamed protein product, partial [Taenia asiatica]|uniref:Nucleolin n=1 Tax=Taenia asiatica TaxID=60517 RepID=A0A0R3W4V9_TAEAS
DSKEESSPNVQSTKANGPSVTKSVGKKRPREEDSDDNDSENKLDAAQVKKLKQMIVEDADDSGSTELDVEGESEVDSDEDSEEYGDGDDSDHNGDTEDEFPEKVVKPTNSREKAQQQRQQTDVKSNPEKSKGTTKQLEPKVRAQEQFKVSTSNILLFNFPRLVESELRGFLTKRNVRPESISCINSPVALLGFADDAVAKKAVSACSGAAYSQNSLAAVSITGGDIGLIRSSKNPYPGRPDAPLTCLFVTSIPKSVTEKEILKIVGVEPKHLRLITSGRKNNVFNACYVDCNSEDDAKKAFEALQNHRFGELQVKVFLKPQSNFNPVTETSLIVTNVPFSAEIDDVKKQFPSAKKVELTRRGCFMLSFDSVEERAKVLQESEGKVMGGRALRFITSEKSNADYSVFVSNIAFAVTADELKAAFPGCKSVFMMKKKDGRFNGNAIVYFATREAAEAAAKEGAKQELKGRVLKTKMQDGSAGPSTDIKSSAISEKASEKPKPRAENKAKTELPAQVGSESEEEEGGDDEEEEEEEEEEEDDDDEEVDEGDSGDDSVDEEADVVEEGDVSDSDAEEDGPVSKRSKQDQISAAKGRGGKREARGGRGGGFVHRGNRGGGRFQNRGGRGGRGRGGPFKK